MSNDARITILVDNHAGEGLAAEHAFSLLIEAAGRRILFDTGQGPALAANVRALQADLRDCHALVISHGHYDHTGGLPFALGVATGARVYGHPGLVITRYAVTGGSARAVHIPADALAALHDLPAGRLHWVTRPLPLTEGIALTGPIPRETDYEDTGGPFFLDPEGARPDPIDDDLALWMRTSRGLVVCLGCCHAGLVNTLDLVRRQAGHGPIQMVLGGFHLVNAERRRLDETVAALRALDVQHIVPCHCTGDVAVAALRDALGERVVPGESGAFYRC